MRQNSEPSVEEILESIKKVIARDTRADAAHRARKESEATTTLYAAPRRGAGVLDLAEVATQVLANERGPVRDDGLVHDTSEFDAEDDAPLLAQETSNSMRDTLATLAMMAQPGAAPQIVRSGETSLEGMVRDMLRPMLANWLDTNLPPMVEKLVSAEIARIVGKRS
jgi:cell pole-organizing protein PopZ